MPAQSPSLSSSRRRRVAIPGGREHTIRNESAAEARAFVVFAPGAPMERFARAAAAGTADVIALAAAHGIEITRPLVARG